MSCDDFRSLKSHPIENASQLARRMAEMGSSPKPAHGRLPGGGNSSRPPPLMGEIVEVEGGHIVRSTGRKDRHSKVYTAKGPRDRRVRLSANTAIQFYDLQDRLGYDRPSKAVAWLIEKAKASIDELARLPEARPPTNEPKEKDHSEESEAQSSGVVAAAAAASIRADQSRAIARERARERAKERTQGRDAVAKATMENNNTANNVHSFLNSRGNNMFSNINATNSLIQAMHLQTAASKDFAAGQTVHAFELGMPPSDSNSRNLHLQASQLPQQQPSRQQPFYQSLLAQTSQALQNFSSQFDAPPLDFTPADNSAAMGRDHHIQTQTQQGLFSSSAASAFQVPSSAAAAAFVRGIAMSEQQHQHHHEFGGGQQPRSILRALWNNDITTNAAPDFGPFGNHVALNIRGSHQYHQQNSFTARGTLQSSSSPVRVRPMPLAQDRGAADQLIINSTATTATSGGSCFSGFRIPARIQGIDEHDDVKPSAASSNSHL